MRPHQLNRQIQRILVAYHFERRVRPSAVRGVPHSLRDGFRGEGFGAVFLGELSSGRVGVDSEDGGEKGGGGCDCA